MRIAFFGTSEFVGSIQEARFLRRLMAAGIQPAVVVTAPDAPSGREREPIPLAVKSMALESGIPVFQPPSLKGFSEEFAQQEIELSLVVAYGKILPSDVLTVPKFGSLNVHPSLLPRWRGPTPIQATILAGDHVTGVTIILMDEQMDHGPVIAQREFPLGERAWTAPALTDALTDLGVELFLQILEPWVRGKITAAPQNHEAATYSRTLQKEDGRINWAKSADEIERMVRAFQPWPGTYTFWQRGGKRVRLAIEEVGVQSLKSKVKSFSGTVVSDSGDLFVQCGDDSIVIRRLKLEGRKSMSAAEFLKGHPDVVGSVLE